MRKSKYVFSVFQCVAGGQKSQCLAKDNLPRVSFLFGKSNKNIAFISAMCYTL